jgi:hypothetical protein
VSIAELVGNATLLVLALVVVSRLGDWLDRKIDSWRSKREQT